MHGWATIPWTILVAACAWVAPALAQSAAPDGTAPSAVASALAERGIELNAVYLSDALGNVRGGTKRGWIYQGKFEVAVAADLDKLAGFDGWSFHVSGFNSHNTGRLRRDYIAGINTVSNIEGRDGTRLSELWLEMEFYASRASLRFGQLAADVEFFASASSALFLQSDWPTIAAANLPSGGPAFPLSAPGVRLKIDPTAQSSLLLAVFNGDPAGSGLGDEQQRNRHGLEFRTSDPALIMGELQFRRHHENDATGLARTVKIGGWHHHAKFDHRRFAHDGTLLADPASSGIAAQRKSNSGLYAIVEQQLFRPRGGDADSGVSAFGRVSTTRPDRNLISFFLDGGLVFADVIAARPHDKFGLSVMYARFPSTVRAFDRDLVFLAGATGPIRDHEANIEFTYSAQLTPGWSLQPVLTFVRHPSGDASRNATVTGVRSVLRF